MRCTTAGAHRHGAFLHHQAVAIEGGGDLAHDRFHLRQVGAPIRQRGRADADEEDWRVAHAGGDLGGEVQAAGALLRHQLFGQPRLVDHRIAGLQTAHLSGIAIDAQHAVP